MSGTAKRTVSLFMTSSAPVGIPTRAVALHSKLPQIQFELRAAAAYLQLPKNGSVVPPLHFQLEKLLNFVKLRVLPTVWSFKRLHAGTRIMLPLAKAPTNLCLVTRLQAGLP